MVLHTLFTGRERVASSATNFLQKLGIDVSAANGTVIRDASNGHVTDNTQPLCWMLDPFSGRVYEAASRALQSIADAWKACEPRV
ncbi:hypothetical protein HYFRA_00007491 [Hymenoscyphus fraxineus]|uniref:Uncharacterized protein n=1 Tax=Hymenoscyphus fraxineus TaxID=746836 RepID=A0A9N9PQ10_9HELO|nr:hypothetical protein HYFRA_00007491 [Hymenoscyphus fraxineus]